MTHILERLNNNMQSVLSSEFTIEKDFKYRHNFKENRYFDIYESSIKNKEWRVTNLDVNWLFDWFRLHFEYAIYALVDKKDDTLAKHHLGFAIEYGYFCLEYGSQMCGSVKPSPFIIMNKAVFIMSLLLINDDKPSFLRIGKHLIDSLNGKNCIIKNGNTNSTISWFLLELFSASSGQAITLHKALRPKLVSPYDEISLNWDTQDEQKIEKYIHLLCDAHSAQADIDYAIHQEEEFDSFKYRELFIVSMYFIPFEVILWLKLREIEGLKNPEKFSHPLMNTAIARMFLELKEPLPKPKSLPYKKELLTKLKKKYPDIEMTE